MSASETAPKKPPESLTTRYRKLLWGIRQDQAKLLRLVEITSARVQNALELSKEKAQGLGKHTESPTAARLKKEAHCLRRELKILQQLTVDLESCHHTWLTLQKPKVDPSETAQKQAKGGSTILVIDDDRITAKSIEHFLRQKHYTVMAIRNAEEGLEKAFTLMPDLILLDIMMPGMNGYQFLELIKQDERTEKIPVIILSSLSRESDILEGLEKGAVDFIVKPYSPQVLISKVAKILSIET
ncbi:MAG: PleD family two-component system response regulator [Candidatus Aminicenantaceae bacterium]